MIQWRAWDADKVRGTWNRILPLVRTALAHGNGEYEELHILIALEEQKMQIWTMHDDSKLVGIVVTEILIYPAKRVCYVVLIAGVKFRQWLTFLPDLEQWAREKECKDIRALGRFGFKRLLPWPAKQVLFVKEL